jgi:rhamnopyranosyl-N-acetylglucosaminyl-diphospho-decaprenol beta-1,3/1,4-galactofuranosyltransferase
MMVLSPLPAAMTEPPPERVRPTVTVAAAVTTYNRLASLQRCIEAIRAQERPPDEIIVVNDLSRDGTREWLDSQPDIVAIHQPDNYGCSASFHTVLEAAYERGHDFAWTMDDDVFPGPDALRLLLETAEQLQRRGIRLGGLTAYQAEWDEGGTTWLPFRLPSTLGRALKHRFVSPEVGIERGKGEPQEIDFYPFISTLFSRDAMATVGYPRSDFYYYGEDTDYALRLADHGFRSYIVPRCVVRHEGGGFMAPVLLPIKANWRHYYMYRNQLALVRIHQARLGRLKAYACRLRIFMGAAKRLIMEAGRANFAACRLTLLGLGDGLRGRMGKRIQPGS